MYFHTSIFYCTHECILLDSSYKAAVVGDEVGGAVAVPMWVTLREELPGPL